MFKDLFNKQKDHLDHFFNTFSERSTRDLLSKLRSLEGTVIFTGVGKSGIVANKLAMTFVSTGTKALFLSAQDALHGDLGIVTDKDLMVILSKSGESDELLQLLPFVKSRGAEVVAIVCAENSRLSQGADLSVSLPLKGELGPYEMVPTTSTAIQMIYGDVLAMALMQEKGVTLEQFAQNHPAGQLGKRLTLRVKDLMLRGKSLPLCSKEQQLKDVLGELSNKRCGCLLVVDEQMMLEGFFTDGDLRRVLTEHGAGAMEQKMEAVMNPEPRLTAKTQLAYEALVDMEKNPQSPIMQLPVVEEGKLVGLLRMHDLLQQGL